MRIIHLSYAQMNGYRNPNDWLEKLGFFVGILEAMTVYGDVKSIHCISSTGIICKNGVEYHFLKKNRFQLLFPFSLHRYIKNLKPDVIVVHGLIFSLQMIFLRWQLGKGVKIIAQHHAEKPYQDFRRYLQRWADVYIGAYLFCSIEQGKPWVNGNHIRHLSKVKPIMGTSSSFSIFDKASAKAKTGVKEGIAYIWVGRLDANKDPLLVIRAFARFLKINPSVNLYMIYQTFELQEEVDALIKRESALPGSIHLKGKVAYEELLYWYNSADFIISSSHYEGSGVAVCEGISCGCIPILTDIPSFRSMTNDGRIGLLYDVANEDALLNSLQKSLTLDRKKMKQQVLEYFNTALSFEANAQRIAQVIHSL